LPRTPNRWEASGFVAVAPSRPHRNHAANNADAGTANANANKGTRRIPNTSNGNVSHTNPDATNAGPTIPCFSIQGRANSPAPAANPWTPAPAHAATTAHPGRHVASVINVTPSSTDFHATHRRSSASPEFQPANHPAGFHATNTTNTRHASPNDKPPRPASRCAAQCTAMFAAFCTHRTRPASGPTTHPQPTATTAGNHPNPGCCNPETTSATAHPTANAATNGRSQRCRIPHARAQGLPPATRKIPNTPT